jgi:hypothetical protein
MVRHLMFSAWAAETLTATSSMLMATNVISLGNFI